MLEAAGEFALGEGQSAARTLAQRLWTGPRRIGFAVYVGFLLFGLWGVSGLGVALQSGGALFAAFAQGGVTMVAMMAYIIALSIVFLGWRERTIKAIWTQRGQQDPMAMRWIVGDDAFVVVQQAQETRIAWAGVSEVAPARRHWLILANMAAHCVPRGCFADVAAERAFVAAIVARLPEAARARSPEAVAFAGA
jgi:hypothetical protein